ncbi:MAG: phosphate transport system permease protein [Actinomycetota bacterium]|nr:phosphate transport system permease protein [Actinomycetota bacterium]
MATITRPPEDDAPPVELKGSAVRKGDRVFRGATLYAGIGVLVVMAAIAIFLVWRSIPSLTTDSVNFFTYQEWFPDDKPPTFGIAALAFGTFMTAIIAMVIAVPIGIGAALFIAFYAPRKLAATMAFVMDVLAAVPSIIFGLWGLQFLMPNMFGLTKWMNDYLGFIPLFKNTQGIYTKSIFIAAVVLAIMILPTMSAITREVFTQVPQAHREAALALGATRWEMIRVSVFPFARPGMISGAMLALGRALGETIAVALILSALFTINWHITEPGGNTFAANIALKWNEAGPNGLSALIASGLVLFVITMVVNMIARWIIARRAAFSGANS